MKRLLLIGLIITFVVSSILPIDGASQRSVILRIGSPVALVDGQSVEMGVAPFIYQNRTYVPLRFLVEQMGARVEYSSKEDGTVDQIYITLPVTETASPPPLLPNDLQIVSTSSFISEVGHTHIVGEVINQGRRTANAVKVIATLYGSDGKVVGTDFTFTQPSSIDPGNKAPFEIIWLESIPWSRYTMQLEWS
jgi:hypothetical protein